MATNGKTATEGKKITPTEQNAKDIQDLKKNFEGLNGKLDQLLAALAGKSETSTPVSRSVKTPEAEKEVEVVKSEVMDKPDKYKVSSSDEITFVHLIQRAPGLSTFIKISTAELNLTTAGELFSFPKLQADEFVGKYRKWFTDGIFAVYNDEVSIRYAETKKIKPATFYEYSKYNLDSIGDLDYNDLEDLVDKLAPAHKDNVIQYFKQKVYAAAAGDKDPRFCDPRKLEILNRLSGCDSLKYEIEDLKKIK